MVAPREADLAGPRKHVDRPARSPPRRTQTSPLPCSPREVGLRVKPQMGTAAPPPEPPGLSTCQPGPREGSPGSQQQAPYPTPHPSGGLALQPPGAASGADADCVHHLCFLKRGGSAWRQSSPASGRQPLSFTSSFSLLPTSRGESPGLQRSSVTPNLSVPRVGLPPSKAAGDKMNSAGRAPESYEVVNETHVCSSPLLTAPAGYYKWYDFLTAAMT